MKRKHERSVSILVAVTVALFFVALYHIFLVAPVEATMGIVQKIFYFHVPCAFATYMGFITCAIGSLMYLIQGHRRWDALAVAGAEVGLIFCTLVLTTGPLWARGAWGVFWVWDPQLTLTLLLYLIYLAYLFLRQLTEGSHGGKKAAAVLGLLGAIDIPFIRTAVQNWRGQHPAVIRRGGQGLMPEMAQAFGISAVTFLCIFTLILVLRYRLERSRQRLDILQLELAERSP